MASSSDSANSRSSRSGSSASPSSSSSSSPSEVATCTALLISNRAGGVATSGSADMKGDGESSSPKSSGGAPRNPAPWALAGGFFILSTVKSAASSASAVTWDVFRVAHSTATRREKVSTSRPLAQRGAATSCASHGSREPAADSSLSSASSPPPGRTSRFSANCSAAMRTASWAVKSGKSTTSETRLLRPGLTLSSRSVICPAYPASTTTILPRYCSSVSSVTISSTASCM
mmetsp:Transcript_16226/g.37604  ORF Transcript_16226/g.37604 Transcript_16226/m.37604 type:complete len:232 (-) Transcript_16226:1190-1885(-)